MKINKKEMKLFQKLYENKWVFDEECYQLSYELMKDDEPAIEKAKILLYNRVLRQIQQLFGRQCAYGDGDDTLEAWLSYILWEDLDLRID